eukprot:12081572-Alexandrium_andersonii.AAC.1
MEEFPTLEPPADPWKPMEVQSTWTSDCPRAPKGNQAMPDLEPGHVSIPFAREQPGRVPLGVVL